MATRFSLSPTGTLSVVALLAGLLAAGPAPALERCKLKQSRKTGALQFSARGVDGTLQFGFTDATRHSRFPNEATCVAGDRAKGCQIADPATPEASVPPPLCRLHVRDASESCVATLKRCTPGIRPVCPPDMEPLGGDCIERRVSGGLEFANAIQSCAARGRSLCSVDQLQRCDSTNLSKDTPGSCGDVTDGGAGEILWTSSPLTIPDQNVYDGLVTYGGNNEVRIWPSELGSIYDYFCCAPLGAR